MVAGGEGSERGFDVLCVTRRDQREVTEAACGEELVPAPVAGRSGDGVASGEACAAPVVGFGDGHDAPAAGSSRK